MEKSMSRNMLGPFPQSLCNIDCAIYSLAKNKLLFPSSLFVMFLFADLSARKQLRVPMYTHISLSLLALLLRLRIVTTPIIQALAFPTFTSTSS